MTSCPSHIDVSDSKRQTLCDQTVPTSNNNAVNGNHKRGHGHGERKQHGNNFSGGAYHERFPEAGWISVFTVPCWICPSSYSFDDDGDNADGDCHNDDLTSTCCGDDDKNNNTSSKDKLPNSDGLTKILEEQDEKENDEVLGWTLDAAARGVAVMGTAVFVSSDLLRLAKEATGCYMYDEYTWEDNTECNDRVMGMRPSSILAAIVMIVGLISALVMPLVGSIIDHTKYRRGVGSVSAALMSIFILLQMLVMERNWFIAAILQIFVAFAYTIHLCAVYAYLPELTPDHEKLMNYTARFSASQYMGSVFFLLLMVVVLSVFNQNNTFRSSALSQSIVFLVCCVFFGYAWARLFRSRPPSQNVPEGKTLLSAGFWKIYKTTQIILMHHSAIKWFLISAAFTEAATTTFSTIAITYMTEQLGFTSKENGIAILILLLAGVPGTRVAAWLASSINPIRSLQCCLVFWIITIIAASLTLYEQNQQGTAYVFAMLWGLAIGWVYPTEKTLYVTIIPKGQEAELMGTYICACQMLSWLPPLVFSIINEANFSMRIGMLSLTMYFAASMIVLFFVGDYDQAVAHAKSIDDGVIAFTMSKDLVTVIGQYYEDFADNPEICQQNFVSPAISTSSSHEEEVS